MLNEVASSESGLGKEAHHLHACFFRRELDAEVIARYVEASASCCPGPSRLMTTIVSRKLDAEAIELALRLRTGPSILTKKIQILFYLLEVRSAYYSYFAGGPESRPRAALGIANSLVRTALKYLKGEYLIRRHGIV